MSPTFKSIQLRLVRIASHLHQTLWWLRAKTIGVRAIVLDGNAVFLIRHSYRPGWYLPGGGIDRREAPEAAVLRELQEEGCLRAEERPSLLGFYRHGRHDYVACYVIRRFGKIADRVPDWEIAETGFFPLDALPDGTTRATRTRLAELLQGQPISDDW